jgi:hypothetical protein
MDPAEATATSLPRVDLFDRLIDDAAMSWPREASVADAVSEHREHRAAWFAELIGPLVVPDQRLAEVGRAAADEPVPVSVINTGGAGGLLALARRTVPGVEVVAVESALRDLDDLAGNVARVAAAAGELGDLPVFVEIPYVPGWVDAVEETEAAGLLGKLSFGGPRPDDCPTPDRLAEQLSVLVEADLPFKAVLAGDEPHRHRMLTVLLALSALIDGARLADAAELLRLDQPDRIRTAVEGWDEAAGTRVRRRLRSFSCCRAREMVAELESLGLVAADRA